MPQPVSRRGRLIPGNVPVQIHQAPEISSNGDRLALIASYSPNGRVTRSLETLIAALQHADYEVVLVRASEWNGPLDWPSGAAPRVPIIVKPNLGYDFGSWAVGMAHYRELLSRKYVILVNDSLVGPFASLAPLIENFEASACDVWGVTQTTQFIAHLQSYFLGFKNGSLADPAIRHFWNSLPVENDKLTMVHKYELGLARLLFAEAFVTGAMFAPELVAQHGQNPTLVGWHRLLDLGFPFVKRTLLTDPSVALDGRAVPATLRERFGINVRDWL